MVDRSVLGLVRFCIYGFFVYKIFREFFVCFRGFGLGFGFFGVCGWEVGEGRIGGVIGF